MSVDITAENILRIIRNAVDRYDVDEDGVSVAAISDPEDIGIRIVAAAPGAFKIFRIEVTGEK